MSVKHIFHNNFETTIVGAITDIATTATLANVGPLATPGRHEVLHLTLFDGNQNVEIVKVTAVSGSNITIERNQDGTTGPVGGWPDGTAIAARVIAAALGNMVQGSPPRRAVKTDLDPWLASTAVTVGDVVYKADAYLMICIKSGTTGVTEPTGSGIKIDGTAEWQSVWQGSGPYDDMFEAGVAAFASGDQCMALGDRSRALENWAFAAGWEAAAGNSATAVGARAWASDGGLAVGLLAGALEDGTALGYSARARGRLCTAIGHLAGNNTAVGREGGRKGVLSSLVYGTNKFVGADYSIAMLGHPIVSAYKGSFASGANIIQTAEQSTGEAVIYSVPVNLGNSPAWAASTVYKHGDVVFPTTPNARCYVAKCVDAAVDDYFNSKTSGTVEPVWPTTVGSSVTDVTGLVWECVDRTNIEFAVGNYSRFVPISLGFICDEGASPTTQPSISFGIPGNLTKWLASTATTKLTAALAGEFFTPTNTEGSKTMAAALVTPGTGNITGRFYLKGMVVETMTA